MASSMCLSAYLIESQGKEQASASPGTVIASLVITGLGQVPRDESLISRGQKRTSIISGNGEFASCSRAAARLLTTTATGAADSHTTLKLLAVWLST